MQLLADARARGLDVRVVVDRSDPAATWPGPDNSPAITWLRQHDISVYEDELHVTTHGKVLLIDQTAVVGSHNWTATALTRNRELSMLSKDAHAVVQLASRFEAVFNQTSDN
jgi:phosphatidylserine/phosphatidylglycerophosphate/cardiolipin synthase-like enzyme